MPGSASNLTVILQKLLDAVGFDQLQRVSREVTPEQRKLLLHLQDCTPEEMERLIRRFFTHT